MTCQKLSQFGLCAMPETKATCQRTCGVCGKYISRHPSYETVIFTANPDHTIIIHDIKKTANNINICVIIRNSCWRNNGDDNNQRTNNSFNNNVSGYVYFLICHPNR